MSARRVPARWSVFKHLKPYRLGNSPRGIALAAAEDDPDHRALDIDVNMTADGIGAATHWNRLSIERWRYTEASVRAGIPASKVGKVCHRKVSDLPWKVVRTLRTRDGYRIYTVGYMLNRAAKVGVRIELEPKGTPSIKWFQHVARIAKRLHGADWRERVQVKRLAVLRGWRTCLNRAAAAGFYVFVLRHTGARLPNEWFYRR
jgi:hypothetical protein